MSSPNPPDVRISEVGPRDGLQSVATVMPTAAKRRWIAALHAAGLREIEVGSFVPAKLLPQLADTAEIVAFARGLPELTVLAQVRAQDHCLAHEEHEIGVHALAVPLRNAQGRTVAALNVVTSAARLSPAAVQDHWLPLLHDAALELRPLL